MKKLKKSIDYYLNHISEVDRWFKVHDNHDLNLQLAGHHAMKICNYMNENPTKQFMVLYSYDVPDFAKERINRYQSMFQLAEPHVKKEIIGAMFHKNSFLKVYSSDINHGNSLYTWVIEAPIGTKGMKIGEYSGNPFDFLLAPMTHISVENIQKIGQKVIFNMRIEKI